MNTTRAGDPLCVLIVDDDPLVRWALATMLRHHGCLVHERASARAATQALTESADAFDVVLLDYDLPDSHGLALLAIVRQFTPDSHVMMLSADMTHEEMSEATRLGACAIVPKPFDLDEVWALMSVARPG